MLHCTVESLEVLHICVAFFLVSIVPPLMLALDIPLYPFTHQKFNKFLFPLISILGPLRFPVEWPDCRKKKIIILLMSPMSILFPGIIIYSLFWKRWFYFVKEKKMQINSEGYRLKKHWLKINEKCLHISKLHKLTFYGLDANKRVLFW